MLTILYVADQAVSRSFYASVLGRDPILDVPGMTEFPLNAGAMLGLMPVVGIQRLLAPELADLSRPQSGGCELYLPVSDPTAMLEKVVVAGGRVLSPTAERSWGDTVAYAQDPDGHVLAFCQQLDS